MKGGGGGCSETVRGGKKRTGNTKEKVKGVAKNGSERGCDQDEKKLV